MPSNRYRGNKSVGNKLNRLETQVTTSAKSTADPHLSTGVVQDNNLAAESVSETSVANRAITEDKIARGAIGTEHLGVINELASDSDMRLRAGVGTVIVEGAASGSADLFQVKNSAGTVVHKIDSVGRMQNTNQPYFQAISSGGPVYASSDPIYSNVIWNVGSHYDPSNGRFTAPVTGRYYFSASFFSAINLGGVAGFMINGTGRYIVMGGREGSETYWAPTTISTIVQLTAGEYIMVKRYTGSVHMNDSLNSFSGYLIG